MSRARCLEVALAGTLVLALSTGCDPPPTRAEATHRQRVIKDWLECEECGEDELEAVVSLGATAIDVLGSVLRGGLSPASRARFQAQLEERFRTRVAYGERHPGFAPRMTQKEFVSYQLDNRDALYRVRSIRALRRIGTPPAIDALRQAAGFVGHAGVEREIRRVLDEL